MDPNGNRSFKYLEYASVIGVGVFQSRADFAEFFNVSYSTAKFHLEKAVALGQLVKVWGVINEQSGWLYCLPETQPRLEGL